MTKKQIEKKLKKLGVEFDSKNKKEELEKLLKDAETITEEEEIEEIEEEIEDVDVPSEEEEEDVDVPEDDEEEPVAEEKKGYYVGKKVVSKNKVKINGIERETVLLETGETIVL